MSNSTSPREDTSLPFSRVNLWAGNGGIPWSLDISLLEKLPVSQGLCHLHSRQQGTSAWYPLPPVTSSDPRPLLRTSSPIMTRLLCAQHCVCTLPGPPGAGFILTPNSWVGQLHVRSVKTTPVSPAVVVVTPSKSAPVQQVLPWGLGETAAEPTPSVFLHRDSNSSHCYKPCKWPQVSLVPGGFATNLPKSLWFSELSGFQNRR